ncbi:MAG TPA: sugar ABC transporter permease [Clostridiales bacterium]|nr:sugar ABC transporter permease [Clostridiales bacterium]
MKKKSNIIKGLKKSIPLYILLLPSAVLLFCFAYIPMYGLIIAFKDYTPGLGIMGSPWVGFKHFIKFFNSYQFGLTIKNTLSISIYGILVGFPLPIAVAILCNQIRNKKFKKFFQVTTYLPHFISTMVMCGLILIFLSPSSGIMANFCKIFGLQIPNFMASSTAFKHVYVWSDIWQHLGWDSIIYLAAISAIDPTYYEAATIDGASTLQKIRYIDLPLILPTAMILLILRAGGILSVGFEKVLLLQNTQNAMGSEIISTYVYKVGLQSFQYSLSTAIGLFNTLVNLLVLLVVNWFSKKTTDTSLI